MPHAIAPLSCQYSFTQVNQQMETEPGFADTESAWRLRTTV